MRCLLQVFNRLGLGDIFAITDIEAASVWGQLRGWFLPLPCGSAALYPRLDADAIVLSIE